MVYSVETVTEAFWALFLYIIYLYIYLNIYLFISFFPPFLLLFCGKVWRLIFKNNLFYITIIINQCK